MRRKRMIDNINHPSHYENGFAMRNLECIDITKHCDFCVGNVIKYVWRAGKKGNALEDLDKADWYLKAGVLTYSENATLVFQFVEKPEDEIEQMRWLTIRAIICANYVDAELGIEKLREMLK